YGLFAREREHYMKTDTKLEWFYTLWELPVSESYTFKGVFGIHSGLSFILPQYGRNEVSIETSNELSVDGMFNGRGWSSLYSDKGHVLFENWVEVRIPLAPGLLSWDFFFDAAGVEKKPSDFFDHLPTLTRRMDPDNPNDLRKESILYYSFGGELRFTIPQFPLRFGLVKRFQYQDGKIMWKQGALFSKGDNPRSGVDFVVSFALSSY
ncbi:BamA/TamA family outer membrane protein, partial [Breznakiellaceae bacterium SP9]